LPNFVSFARMSELKSLRLQMVITPSQVARIDQWRGREPGVPSRSEAIRQLVEFALHWKELEAEGKRQKEKA